MLTSPRKNSRDPFNEFQIKAAAHVDHMVRCLADRQDRARKKDPDFRAGTAEVRLGRLLGPLRSKITEFRGVMLAASVSDEQRQTAIERIASQIRTINSVAVGVLEGNDGASVPLSEEDQAAFEVFLITPEDLWENSDSADPLGVALRRQGSLLPTVEIPLSNIPRNGL